MDLGFGHYDHLRVPPDSTGKRLFTGVLLAIQYTSGVSDFGIDDEIVGVSSGFFGEIVQIKPGSTTASGTIFVVPDVSTLVQDVTAGEQLTVNAVIKATVSSSSAIHSPGNSILSSDNPLNGMRVDREGAAFVRFNEGPQLLGSFGGTKTSPSEQLASYVFIYDEDPTEWSFEFTGTASLTHISDESSVAIDIGTDPGDQASYTTNRYHIYQPGFGQLIMMTVTCGDIGKSDVIRRWGYFDDEDGLFFELDGTDLYVVERSSASGTVSNENKVLQSNLNGDRVNGTTGRNNLSGMNLDVSKINLYWMDFAWLGAGKSRFGVYGPNGERITLHTFQNPNTSIRPFLSNPILPVRIEQVNSDAAGSPSRLKLTCAQVEVEGKIVPTFHRRSAKWNIEVNHVANGETHLVSWRPGVTFKGKRNSKTTVGESFRAYVTEQPCHIRLYVFSDISGAAFSNIGSEFTGEYVGPEADFNGGQMIFDWYLDVGTHAFSFPPNINLLGVSGRLNADNTQDVVSMTIESLEPTAGDTNIKLTVAGIDI